MTRRKHDTKRPAACVGLAVLALASAGCDHKLPTDKSGKTDEVTPARYWDLPPQQQAAIRKTTIYIPEEMGYDEIEANPGPWASTFERMVHQGETDYFVWQLARTVFEFEHPTILLEGMIFDMWSGDIKALLSSALHSRRSPAMYIARSLPESIVDGWYADITEDLDDWPEARDHPITRALGTFDGRVYCLPAPMAQWPAVAYRKDFFREIGVTNEFGEPGPPSNWTWSDFRRYARMLTKDTDGDGRTDRYGFVAEKYHFDVLAIQCNGLRNRMYVPDPTGEYVWRFNPDDPRVIRAIREFRAMHRIDKSVLADVHHTWLVKERELGSDKVAMAFVTSLHAPEWALIKPEMFPRGIKTIDALGIVPLPRSDPVGTDTEGSLLNEASMNMFGFNPIYSPEQRKAAVDWYKSFACGYWRLLYVTTLREKNKAWGRPDPYPQYDLTKAYAPVVPLPPGQGRQVYPKDWVNVYDVCGGRELLPTPETFGLLPPVQFNDAVNNLCSELLFARMAFAADGTVDEAAEDATIKRTLAEHAAKINARCMNQKIADDEQRRQIRERMERYYTALREYSRRNDPPAAAADLADFIETRCRCW